MSSDRQRLNRRKRITPAQILVLALAWSQVSLAVHQFEHSIDEIGESCSVCLQFERSDDALAATGSPVPSPWVSTAAAGQDAVAARVETLSPYQSRASP